LLGEIGEEQKQQGERGKEEEGVNMTMKTEKRVKL
jgi:hypothetical protein